MHYVNEIIGHFYRTYIYSYKFGHFKTLIRKIILKIIAKNIANKIIYRQLYSFSCLELTNGLFFEVMRSFSLSLYQETFGNLNIVLKKYYFQKINKGKLCNMLKSFVHKDCFPIKQIVLRQLKNTKWIEKSRLNNEILRSLEVEIARNPRYIGNNKKIIFIIQYLSDTDLPLKLLADSLGKFMNHCLPANIPDQIPSNLFDIPLIDECKIECPLHPSNELFGICSKINHAAHKSFRYIGFFTKMQKPYRHSKPQVPRFYSARIIQNRRHYQQQYEYFSLLIFILQLLEILLRDIAENHSMPQKDIVNIYKKLHKKKLISEECFNKLDLILSKKKLNLRNKIQHGALNLIEAQRAALVNDYNHLLKSPKTYYNYFYLVVKCINLLWNYYPEHFKPRQWDKTFLLSIDELDFLNRSSLKFENKDSIRKFQFDISKFIDPVFPCTTITKLAMCSCSNRNDNNTNLLLFSFFPSTFESIYRNLILFMFTYPIIDPPSSHMPFSFRYKLLDSKNLTQYPVLLNLLSFLPDRFDKFDQLQRIQLLIKIRDAFAHGALLLKIDSRQQEIYYHAFLESFYVFSKILESYMTFSPLNRNYNNIY